MTLGMALAMVLSAPMGVAAAQQTTAEIQKKVAAAKTRLKLAPDQEQKLRALLEEEGAKLKAIESKYEAAKSPQTRRAKLQEARAVQEEFRGRLAQILSREQMAEWDKMRDEGRTKARERKRGQ